MVEKYLRQSPLAALGLDGRASAERVPDAGVVLAEAPFRKMVNLRGDRADKAFLDGVKKVTGLNLPTQVGTTAGKHDETCLFCLGPDEWLVTAPRDDAKDLADTLAKALKSIHAAVNKVGQGGTVIAIEGAHARDVLSKGCSLDLHPKVFMPGRCAQTLLARAAVLLHQTAYDKATGSCAYDVHVRWSFADYLFRWLEDAGLEYCVEIGPNH